MVKSISKASLNYSVGLLLAALSGIMMYIERIIFVSHFGLEYVGLSSLFENTFLILSAFDIGVNTYLLNYLVSSVKKGREDEIRGSLSVVRTYYTFISLIIFTLGVILSFFIPLLTKNEIDKRASLFFLIYLVGNLSQYLFGSSILLLSSYERNYVVSSFVQGGRVIQYLVSIFVILKGGDYLLYIAISSLITFLSYLFLSLKSRTDYPFLKGKEKKVIEEDKKKVEKNILGMTFHRGSSLFFRSFEPIMVSLIFGSFCAGLYSNYLLLSNALLTPFWIFQSTVTPSVAIKYLDNSREENLKLYKKLVYINYIASLFVSIVYLLSVRLYISFSYGEVYLLDSSYNALFSFLLFLSSCRTSSLIFRDASAIYTSDWLKALIEVVVTIVLSFVLTPRLGLIGLPLAFIISYLTIVIWRENKTVMEYSLKDGSWTFISKESLLVALSLLILVGVWYITEYFSLLKAIILSLLVFFSVLLIWFSFDKEASRIILKKDSRNE